MNNENRNEEAVSPVIATILMVAITVVLAGVLYVWASSLAEGNTDGDLTLYVFTAEDAGGTVTDGTNDALVRVAMTQGSGINWASLDVKITVGEGTPMTCDRSEAGDGSDVETDCYMAEYGTTNDAEWTIGDGVTIYENGQNLCGAGESCTVAITIKNTSTNQIIGSDSTVAE